MFGNSKHARVLFFLINKRKVILVLNTKRALYYFPYWDWGYLFIYNFCFYGCTLRQKFLLLLNYVSSKHENCEDKQMLPCICLPISMTQQPEYNGWWFQACWEWNPVNCVLLQAGRKILLISLCVCRLVCCLKSQSTTR